MDRFLTSEMRLLIDGPLGTRMHVEALLVLRRLHPAGRSIEELAGLLGGCGVSVVQRCLADLLHAGLLERDAFGAYRYRPTGARLRRTIDEMAHLEATQPLALIRALAKRETGRRVADQRARRATQRMARQAELFAE